MSLNASSWQAYCTKCEKFCCTALNGGCIFQLDFSISWKALRDVDYHGVCQWTGFILLGEKKKTTHFFPDCTHPGQSVPKECVTARNNPETSHIMPLSFPFPVVSLYLFISMCKIS